MIFLWNRLENQSFKKKSATFWDVSNKKLIAKVIKRKFLGFQTLRWAGQGFNLPAPQWVKLRFLLSNQISGGDWIETGTYLGDTSLALSKHSPKVITLEPSRELFEFSRSRLKAKKNVNCMFGSSEELFTQSQHLARWSLFGWRHTLGCDRDTSIYWTSSNRRVFTKIYFSSNIHRRHSLLSTGGKSVKLLPNTWILNKLGIEAWIHLVPWARHHCDVLPRQEKIRECSFIISTCFLISRFASHSFFFCS